MSQHNSALLPRWGADATSAVITTTERQAQPYRETRGEVRVLLVAGELLMRECLSSYLASETLVTVIDAADLREATEVLASAKADVVLVVVSRADSWELASVPALSAVPSVPCLVLGSDIETGDMALQVIRMGARGFLPLDVSLSEVTRAVRAVTQGDAAVTHKKLSVLVQQWSEPRRGHERQPLDWLSSREREVLALLVAGRSTAEMAVQMDISAFTVRSHVQHVMMKLGVHTRMEAAALAVREGLLG